MHPLPQTSSTNYITGKAALIVPNADNSFADWHFDEVFLSGKKTIRVAGIDTEFTEHLLGTYGIRECSDTLRRFGVAVPAHQKVYTANHVRAILDMVLHCITKNKPPEHVTVHDILDAPADVAELKKQIDLLREKLKGQAQSTTALSLLQKWEKNMLTPLTQPAT